MRGIFGNPAQRPLGVIAFWLGMAMATLLAGETHAQPTGQEIFKRECAACHALEPGRNRVGPTMHDIIGRKAGGLDSFGNYSDALKQSDVVWTAETLDLWIEAPKEYIPGNRMAYRGLEDEQKRQQLVEFLQQQDGSP